MHTDFLAFICGILGGIMIGLVLFSTLTTPKFTTDQPVTPTLTITVDSEGTDTTYTYTEPTQ